MDRWRLPVEAMMVTKVLDRDLVGRARDGDERAVAALFDRHWPDAFRTAFAILGRRDAAEDAAQDAFLRALGALDRFEIGRSFGAWLGRIAANCAIDRLRVERRLVPLNDDSGNAWCDAVRDDALLSAVAALSYDRRIVVLLRFWVGMSYDEIGAALGIPPGTAASRLSRAVEELRARLSGGALEDDR